MNEEVKKEDTKNKIDKNIIEAHANDRRSWKVAQQNALLNPVKRRIEESGGNLDDWNFSFGIAECPHGKQVYDWGESKELEECEHGCHEMVEKEEKDRDTSLGELF